MPADEDEIPPSSQAPGVARVTGEASARASTAVPELEAALAVPPDPTAGAFFDVDNTVMRGASIFHLARGLYKRDFFSLRDILGFAWQQLSFLARGENLEHVDQIQAKALGSVAEHVDGVYTGRLVGSLLHGQAKVEAVRALAELEGLDLQRCSAYSDSANDIPLLDLVGNPCAINPDGRLRSHAKAHGWRIRVAAGAGALAGAFMGAAAASRRLRGR